MTDVDGIKNILLLDDDMDFRNLLKTILKKYFPDSEFHEYDPVAKGAPADDYDWSRYDVLVLDYYLCVHRLTGLDLLQKHHKKPGFPAAIMLTGAGTEETAVRAIKFGIYEYLRKEQMDKEVLAKAISNAYSKHAQERIKQDGLEKSRSIFDKSLFYKQLERTEASDLISAAREFILAERVFILIDIDDYATLRTSNGPIASDNLGHFIAQHVYELPGIKQGNPCITRLSESAVGLLVNAPEPASSLESLLRNLCKHFGQAQFYSAGKPMAYTVSIGAVALNNTNIAFENLLAQVNTAKDSARNISGNSFHIYTDKTDVPAHNDAEQVEPAAAPGIVQETSAEAEVQPQQFRSVTDIPLDVDDEQPEAEGELLELIPKDTIETPATDATESAILKPEAATATELTIEDDQLENTANEQTILPPSIEFADGDEPVREGAADTREIIIDAADLDENGLTIKHAIDENRIVQTFQPVIAMFSAGDGDTSVPELFKVDIQMIDVAGVATGAGEFRPKLTALPLQQYIDRWMLRQLIGRIVRVVHDEDKKCYLLIITEAWFSDIALFGWLRILLSGLDQVRPGQYITLEIPATIFLRYQERVMILIKTLRKTYGFRIALGNIDSAETALKIAGLAKFDRVVIHYNLLAQAKNAPAGDKALDLLHSLKATGARVIVDGVENATILTDVISAGADYVMGNFTGEAQTSLHASGNVETYEIS